MFFDIYYVIIVLPFVILSLIASIRVKSTFHRYSRIPTVRGITGAEAARMVLEQNGVRGVEIRRVSGQLTDHYNPKDNAIYLSEDVYDNRSAAACGVAAHEAGHAVQYAEEYLPAKVRLSIVPATNIASTAGIYLILIGLIFANTPVGYLAYAGILLFSMTVLFQLVTLPVEFNASRRAMVALRDSGSLTREEETGAARVLRAAAMTYVAALAVAFAQLLRLILLVSRANDRRR